MARELVELGVTKEKIVVEPDAVDVTQYNNLTSSIEARNTFNFKTDRTVVGYVGRLKTLGMDKGVKDLLLALKILQPQQRWLGLIVGGPKSDQLEYVRQAEELELTNDDVQFIDTLEQSLVPTALAACDVLAMPWPNKRHYRQNMSPLKMFEYMAASKPILTGDLPTIREILDETTAVFCEPDNAESIATQLEWIHSHEQEVVQKAISARALVGQYTWLKRTQRLLSLIQ